jgi:hypothetical protein
MRGFEAGAACFAFWQCKTDAVSTRRGRVPPWAAIPRGVIEMRTAQSGVECSAYIAARMGVSPGVSPPTA